MPYSDAQKAVMGRWNIMAQTPGGDQPAWMEIRQSGPQAVVGQFVGWHEMCIRDRQDQDSVAFRMPF